MHGEHKKQLCRVGIIRLGPSTGSRLASDLPTDREVKALLKQS